MRIVSFDFSTLSHRMPDDLFTLLDSLLSSGDMRMDPNKELYLIETIIRDMNRCWTVSWNEPAFREYIHPDAVAIVPTTPGRLEGKEAYVAGWRAFCEAAIIHEWSETAHTVQIYAGGKSAVVTYFFSISFGMGGHKLCMRGRDMLFLVKEGRKWMVVADQFSPEPVPA
jgi:ketosteroid isomerase-like protein